MLQLLFDFFSGKAKTRIYTTFLGWMLIFHVDVLFIAIFTDQSIIYQKTGQLKGEYVWAYITGTGLWWSIVIELSRIALAATVTYLMIWVIPKLLNGRSYKEELEVEFTLRKMRVDKEEALNTREEKAVNKQLKNLESEKKAVVERLRLEETPKEVKWDAEFNDFIKIRNGAQTLRDISHTVYAEGGNLYRYTGADGWATDPTGVGAENLALADTNGLISFNDKGKLLTLTDKGKYFIKKLNSNDNKK